MKASRRGFLGGILGVLGGIGLIGTEKQITGPTLSDPVPPPSPEPVFRPTPETAAEIFLDSVKLTDRNPDMEGRSASDRIMESAQMTMHNGEIVTEFFTNIGLGYGVQRIKLSELPEFVEFFGAWLDHHDRLANRHLSMEFYTRRGKGSKPSCIPMEQAREAYDTLVKMVDSARHLMS